MKTVSAINKMTGEVIELPVDGPEDILESYRHVNETITAYTELKAKLQKLVPDIVDAKGTFEHDGYMLRITASQTMQYDPVVLREVFDEDTLETFKEYKKTAIDAYIREHLFELGDKSTRLRQTMAATGNPRRTIRLEKVGGQS